MRNTRIDLYKDVFTAKSKGLVTLESIFDKILTSSIDIPKTKRGAYCFASSSAKSKSTQDIQSYTGLMFLDYDKVLDLNKLKNIVSRGKSTVGCWQSPSGNLHSLVRIPICKTEDEFKLRYQAYTEAIKPYVKDICLVDNTASSPVHLTFKSSDSALFVNYQAEQFLGIAAPKVYKALKQQSNPISQGIRSEINSYIRYKFKMVTKDGHQNVLLIGRMLGGMVAANQITREDAESIILSNIGNSAYLGSEYSTDTLEKYTSDCITSIEYGLNVPFRYTPNI